MTPGCGFGAWRSQAIADLCECDPDKVHQMPSAIVNGQEVSDPWMVGHDCDRRIPSIKDAYCSGAELPSLELAKAMMEICACAELGSPVPRAGGAYSPHQDCLSLGRFLFENFAITKTAEA